MNFKSILVGQQSMHDKQHPLRIFLLSLFFVFIAEFGIMYLLAVIEVKSSVNWAEALFDATLLTSMCVPFFWFFFVKPLQASLDLESIKSHKILEMAAEGIISIDTRGIIRSFNQAAQKIFGYSETEAIGNNVSMLMPLSHRDLHDGYIAHYLQTGEAHVLGKSRELDGMRKNGENFPMEISVSEIKLGDTHLFTAMLRDVSEQKLAKQNIERLAHYDTLTHLPNRALFIDRLGQAIMMAKRNQQSIALMYIDLDGFKNINDTLGHHVGDQMLEEVASRLHLCVRASDTLARLGGDEFTMILNDASERKDVEIIAGKVIETISRPFELEGQTLHIGVSIGIARYPDDAATSGTLLIVADKAMYAAKAAGKNTFRFGNPGDVSAVYRALNPDA